MGPRSQGEHRCIAMRRYNTQCTNSVYNEGEMCGIHRQAVARGTKVYVKGEEKPSRGTRTNVPVLDVWEQLRAKIEDDGEFTWDVFVQGMSPKELAYGGLRDPATGKINDKKPKWVPQAFHQACIRELIRRGKKTYHSSYLTSLRYFSRVVEDEEADPRLRFDAAKYIWERVEGKVPDKVVVTEDLPWMGAVADAVVSEEEMIQRARRKLADPATTDSGGD